MLSERNEDGGNTLWPHGGERSGAGARPAPRPRHERPRHGAHPRVPGRAHGRAAAPPEAQAQLERWLIRQAGAAGCTLTIARASSTDWASATFTGARHDLMLAGPPAHALDAWLLSLPEAEIDLRGHLVADLSVAGVERDEDGVLVRIEALTVVEA